MNVLVVPTNRPDACRLDIDGLETPVDLHDYIWRHWSPVSLATLPPNIRQLIEEKCNRREAEFRSHEQPGDVWIEWSHNRHSLCQVGGLKLMRDGICVGTWTLWVA